jgi:hypothetical protein
MSISVLEGSVFEAGSPFIRRMVDVLDEDRNDEIDFREFGECILRVRLGLQICLRCFVSL